MMNSSFEKKLSRGLIFGAIFTIVAIFAFMAYTFEPERWHVRCYKSKESAQSETSYFFENSYTTEQSAINTGKQFERITDCICVVYEI